MQYEILHCSAIWEENQNGWQKRRLNILDEYVNAWSCDIKFKNIRIKIRFYVNVSISCIRVDFIIKQCQFHKTITKNLFEAKHVNTLWGRMYIEEEATSCYIYNFIEKIYKMKVYWESTVKKERNVYVARVRGLL